MNDEDEDRAAILRRRQQLIALALSGLSGVAGCEEAAPVVAEQVAEEQVEARATEATPASDTREEASDPPVVASPEPSAPDPAEVQHAEEAKRRWRERQNAALSRPNAPPRPCLSVLPAPQVCLSPILRRKPDDEPDDA